VGAKFGSITARTQIWWMASLMIAWAWLVGTVGLSQFHAQSLTRKAGGRPADSPLWDAEMDPPVMR
jgi:hypothetical protein